VTGQGLLVRRIMPHIYLGQHEQVFEDGLGLYSRPPGGDQIGSLSLGDATGKVICVYDGPRSYPELEFLLGTDIEDNIGPAQRGLLQSSLRLRAGAIRENKLLDVLREIFLSDDDGVGNPLYDVSGLLRAKPLIANSKGNIEMFLGGFGLLFRERALPGSPGLKATIALYKSDYTRDRVAGITPLDALRRWTDYTMRQLGLTILDQLLPAQFVSDGRLPSKTIIQDTFVEASDTELSAHTATGPNSGFSWAEVSGDADVTAATDNVLISAVLHARAETDLSSANIRSQVSCTSFPTADNIGGAARFNPSAETHYVFITKNQATATHRLFRRVTGSFTQIGNSIDTTAASPTFIPKTEINGTSLEGFIDGSSVIGPETDTNISSYLRAGVYGTDVAVFDLFEAADLGAAPPLGSHALMGVGR